MDVVDRALVEEKSDGGQRTWTVHVGGKRAERAAWTHPDPSGALAKLADHGSGPGTPLSRTLPGATPTRFRRTRRSVTWSRSFRSGSASLSTARGSHGRPRRGPRQTASPKAIPSTAT